MFQQIQIILYFRRRKTVFCIVLHGTCVKARVHGGKKILCPVTIFSYTREITYPDLYVATLLKGEELVEAWKKLQGSYPYSSWAIRSGVHWFPLNAGRGEPLRQALRGEEPLA
jgi:hypothetical protein